jgi:hypothetical protein
VKLKFGKYTGWDIEDIPDDYLEFMINSKTMWIEELQRRERIREAELPWVEKLIKAGYHALATKYHPDHGGSTADFQALNAAMEQLKELLTAFRV